MGRSSNMMYYIFERYNSSSDNCRRGTDDDYSAAAITRSKSREGITPTPEVHTHGHVFQ